MTKNKKTQYDKKIFRIWTMLNKLDSGKHIFTSKLADEFNISVRSIQRDVELLNLVGFPIEPCGKGCYKFVEGFSLGRMMLTEEDATLITFFYDVSHSLGSKFEDSFKNFLKKILSSDKSSPYYLKVCDGIKLRAEYSFADILTDGINNNSYVKIKYVSGKEPAEEKFYEVKPLKMIFYEGFWYLLAQADKEDILRKFRLDRIRSAEAMDEYFDTPANLKLILDESTNVWFEGERNKKVTLEISSEVAEFFKKRNYFPKQKIVKERNNGNIVMESYISDDMEIIPTVLSWIPWVEVVSPKEIKEKLNKRIKAYLEK
ncbi:MAG TPA: WYL domain-containing protein [Candidatus Omnitrophota bacterium]|nr:WYL domain-containing protein [Candidatus Omnitrophota bacterium]HPS21148.1 WYL domain-containing protein [Candidatus Omnitrophota bacterium]